MGLLTEYPDWWVMDPGRGHPPASLLKYLLVQAAYSSFSVRGESLWSHFFPDVAAQVSALSTGTVLEIEFAGSSRESSE